MDLKQLMDPKLIGLAVAGILVVAMLAWLYVRRRRTTTAELRQRFGPEYERAVQEHGTERRAEAQLADREKRVESSRSAFLIQRSGNVSLASGTRCSPASSTTRREPSQKPMYSSLP